MAIPFPSPRGFGGFLPREIAAGSGYPRKPELFTAKHAIKGARDLIGEGKVAGGRVIIGNGVPGHPALQALDLIQPPDQAPAAATAAGRQGLCPPGLSLAGRADKNEVLGDHASLPRARPAAGVGLPRTAAIAGHG
jgi:hypothetical protein